MFLRFAVCRAMLCTMPLALFVQKVSGQSIASGENGRLALAADVVPVESPRAAYRGYLRLANLNRERSQFPQAEKYYQLAHDKAAAIFGERSIESLKAVNFLGETYLEEGRIDDADRYFHQALFGLESHQRADTLDRASVLNNLAVVQHLTGNLSNAVDLMRKVVRVFEVDPRAQLENLGTALSNLAAMLQKVGALPEAMTTARKAVAILERCENSESFPISLLTLGRLQLDAGDSAAAESALRRALKKAEDMSPQDNPTKALILAHLAQFYARTGRDREADGSFRRSIEMNRRLLSSWHPALLDVMGAYADFLRSSKRKGEAKKIEAYVRNQKAKYKAQNPSIGQIVDVRSLRDQHH